MHGNDALMKCKVPSYVADLVEVVGWVSSEATEYRTNNINYGNLTTSGFLNSMLLDGTFIFSYEGCPL